MIVFDDMIADMLSNKKVNAVVTELFIRGRNLSVSLAFITQPYFTASKNIRLNSTHNFAMEISTKSELQKLNLIIYQIFTFKALWIFIKSVLQNHILFWLLILLLRQITLYVSKRIF